jgi:hypothetical protein
MSSIVQRQTDKLKNTTKSENKAYTKDQLLAAIIKSNTIDSFFTDTTNNVLNELKFNEIKNNTEIGKVIFIDEITWYSDKELLVLSKWCQMTDRKLFVFGDNLQEGKAVDISYLQAIQSPTIEYSMRSGWTTTKENADKFRVLTKTINDLDYNVDTRSQIISEFNSIIDSESFTVKYGYDKQGLLVGHKFEENINNVRQFLE